MEKIFPVAGVALRQRKCANFFRHGMMARLARNQLDFAGGELNSRSRLEEGCRMKIPGICRAFVMLFFCSAVPASAAEDLPPDAPTQVNGIGAACTGIGLTARQDPRWQSYSLKMEFAGPGGQYTGGEIVSVRQEDMEIVSVTCAGPWLLLQLPPGRYRVSAEADGQTVTSAAFVPKEGQGRIILRFLKPSGGE